MDTKNNLYDEFGNYIGDDIDSDEEYSDYNEDGMSDGEYSKGSSNNDDNEEDNDDDNEEDNEEDDEEDNEEDNDDKSGKRNKLIENMDELQKVYDGVEVFVEEEDTQDIEEATINKINANVERISFIKKLDVEANRKNFDLVETSLPNNNFSFKYLSELMKQTSFIRNICIAGHFHHGKTTIVDRLIEYTRDKKNNIRISNNRNKNSSTVSFFNVNNINEISEKSNYLSNISRKKKNINSSQIINNYNNNNIKGTPYNSKIIDHLINYTDTRLDEQARGLSIKAMPISLLFSNRIYENIPNNILLNKKKDNVKYKSYLFNIIDTPGHVNFFDELL